MKIKRTKAYNNRIKEIKDNYRANNTFNFDININDKDEFNKNDENNDNNIKTNEINDNKNDNKNENKIINNSINSEVN
jgi:hypothetical protein